VQEWTSVQVCERKNVQVQKCMRVYLLETDKLFECGQASECAGGEVLKKF